MERGKGRRKKILKKCKSKCWKPRCLVAFSSHFLREPGSYDDSNESSLWRRHLASRTPQKRRRKCQSQHNFSWVPLRVVEAGHTHFCYGTLSLMDKQAPLSFSHKVLISSFVRPTEMDSVFFPDLLEFHMFHCCNIARLSCSGRDFPP